MKGRVEGEYPITNQNLIDARVIAIVDDSKIAIRCKRFLDGNNEYVETDIFVESKYFDYADGYEPKPQEPKGNIFTINNKPYTNEQYTKDAARFVEEFPKSNHISLSHAIEDILAVYQFAQEHPFVSNLDHYAEELGWTERQKNQIAKHGIPLVNFFCELGEEVSQSWWNEEYKGGKK